jgi:hypothetical protein
VNDFDNPDYPRSGGHPHAHGRCDAAGLAGSHDGENPHGRCGELEPAAQIIAWIVSPARSVAAGFMFDLSGGRATYWQSRRKRPLRAPAGRLI